MRYLIGWLIGLPVIIVFFYFTMKYITDVVYNYGAWEGDIYSMYEDYCLENDVKIKKISTILQKGLKDAKNEEVFYFEKSPGLSRPSTNCVSKFNDDELGRIGLLMRSLNVRSIYCYNGFYLYKTYIVNPSGVVAFLFVSSKNMSVLPVCKDSSIEISRLKKEYWLVALDEKSNPVSISDIFSCLVR